MRTYKHNLKSFAATAMMLLAGSCGIYAQPGFGSAERMDSGWTFHLNGRGSQTALSVDSTAGASTTLDDSRWQRVSVPHDWGVAGSMSPDAGSCQGYLHGGTAWYRHHIRLKPEQMSGGRRIYVYFEGVYNRSTVYLNGHKLGFRPSGFSSFIYDLTPHLRPGGDNVLAVSVDHSREWDSRWYTGSGINRPVWLVIAPPTHLALWGTAWQLQDVSRSKAEIDITAEVSHAPSTESNGLSIATSLLDADGKVVATSKPQALTSDTIYKLRLTLANPHRWSISDPYLYRLRTRLLAKDGTEVDCNDVPLGVRTLRFDADKGFALNDVWMKVKGVCLHDDAGVLGTAVPTTVWRRRLEQLKSIGVNAIRMSHNPHAPALYSLCDTLGLLVMDEASDEWEFPKRKWLEGWNVGTPGFDGTYDYFEKWIERDVADMVRRDRCHPSIFLWSIGNEVDYPNDPYSHPILDGDGSDFTQPIYGGYRPEQPDAKRIGEIAKRLAGVVRSIDSSRPTTGALAGVVMSNQTAYPEAVDVVGYNYTESRYAEDHKRYPKRVIYGSENRHDLDAWAAVRDNDHIFGQFLWTGIDYLGESGRWPARGSEAGLLNLAGDVKPIGYYRASLWATQPVCYIGTYARSREGGGRRQTTVSSYAPAVWNYETGQPVRVVCYTNAASARLTLNGEPVGGEPRRDEKTGILFWDIDFAPGVLRAEAFGNHTDKGIEGGNTSSTETLASAEVETTGRPYALKATLLDIGEVAQIRVEVVDEQGRRVRLADNEITCMVRGNAHLLGLENGDIRDTSLSTSLRRRVAGGTLIAYIGKGGFFPARQQRNSDANRDAAATTVTFTSPLLQSASLPVVFQ